MEKSHRPFRKHSTLVGTICQKADENVITREAIERNQDPKKKWKTFATKLYPRSVKKPSRTHRRWLCERNLLTYSTVQSPSWAANWFAASQEIPRNLRNPKVHYRTHKRPPPVSILGQHNPVHIPTSHLLEIHTNIIHSSTPRSPHWSLTYSLHGAQSFLSS